MKATGWQHQLRLNGTGTTSPERAGQDLNYSVLLYFFL